MKKLLYGLSCFFTLIALTAVEVDIFKSAGDPRIVEFTIPAAEKEHNLTEAVDKKSAEIAENAPRYEMRFKIIEWYETFKKSLSELF